MKPHNIILFLSLLLLDSCWSQSNRIKADDNSIKAIVRDDNDFVTYRDTLSKTTSIPKAVQLAVESIAKEQDERFIDQIFQVENREGIDLFIIRMRQSESLFYHIVAYDKIKKIVSKGYVSINGKWMNNNEAGLSLKLLTPPLIFFNDFNSDGVKDIVIKERVHNGNMYNAAVWNYITIDSDMMIKKRLFIEARYMSIIDECLIERTYDNSEIKINKVCGIQSSEIGRVFLNIGDSVSIIRQVLRAPEYEGMLITGSGDNESKFLNFGYEFEY